VFLRRLLLGGEDAARWERPALLALLAVAAALYVCDLSASGWANSFYSAAVQAGTKNWEAFFYGSSDAGNSITVDKPPASLWIMELSARVFGLSPLSMLLPEAIMGVVTVALVYAIVRRHFSPAAALISGGVLAITPVAALMFRFNNPDALLVLLTVLATYLTLRGIESGRIRWVVWAGVAVGFAFLTKQLQGFLVVPALGVAYLIGARTTFAKRMLHLLTALAAIVVAAGWWVAIVQLVPASARPYIGGSQTNSFLELTFGYNGFGRITGAETGSVTGGGGAAGAGMWGATGILRLFENEFGGQISWLLPAALVLLVIALVLIGRAPRTDGRRATLLLLGGTLVLTGLVFSFMGGIFHAYYTVALAPSLAAVVGIGTVMLWRERTRLWARLVLATLVLGTAVWAFVLLQEAADWLPWLKWVVLIVAAAGAALAGIRWRSRRMSVLAAAVALTAVLLAPFAYTIQTVTTAHTGSIVTAGPTVASGAGGPGGGFGGAPGSRGGFGQGAAGQRAGQSQGGFGAPSTNGQAPTMPGGTTQGGTAQGGTGTTGQGGAFGRGGGAGGLLGSSNVSSALKALLQKNAGEYTWVAAAIGSNSAAGYQLATGDAVMPIGGFNGSDPSPTLAQFEKLVAEGRIHYFIGGSVGQANGGSNASSEIASWVAKHFTAKTVVGVTVYDLTS
jgi:4-amino-4-deoxy-L-arabinose transferase-like glycosyltransferase